MNLLQFTQRGIYCEKADVYIDPWKPVRRALITHGHSDHARPGHKYYLCAHNSVPILKLRLGNHIKVAGIDYNKELIINGVKISFHPAGHIIGSAQIRVEYKGETWVVSGDYKIEDDGISEAFEPVKCHHFITETTFGLPVYTWKPQKEVFQDIAEWWNDNKEEGKVSVLTAYSLGKAQRIIQNVESLGTIYTHGAIENMNKTLRSNGVDIRDTTLVTPETSFSELKGNLVIAPPSALGSPWIKKFKNCSVGIASGWMALRGIRRRRGADRGFALSDHCDWDGLNTAIEQTGAQHIYATHGYTSIFSQWLNEKGYDAQTVSTEYEGESLDNKGEENE